MEPRRLRCMLVLPDGPARRVGPAGALLGRQGDCDLVTADPRASRRHALVRLTSEGGELVSLGREPATRNGKPVERAAIAHGDTIGVPGLTVTVELEAEPPSGRADAALVLARARGGSFGISHTPFVIGGDPDADLMIKDWPIVVRVHVVDGAPWIELVTGEAALEHGQGGAERETLAPGELVALAIGDSIDAAAERFTVARPTGAAATTAVGAQARELPSRVEIEILPRGGWV
ncbi:MAG: FHA domain-containing protein, partial [Kofleriaceae bacterium]